MSIKKIKEKILNNEKLTIKEQIKIAKNKKECSYLLYCDEYSRELQEYFLNEIETKLFVPIYINELDHDIEKRVFLLMKKFKSIDFFINIFYLTDEMQEYLIINEIKNMNFEKINIEKFSKNNQERLKILKKMTIDD